MYSYNRFFISELLPIICIWIANLSETIRKHWFSFRISNHQHSLCIFSLIIKCLRFLSTPKCLSEALFRYFLIFFFILFSRTIYFKIITILLNSFRDLKLISLTYFEQTEIHNSKNNDFVIMAVNYPR